MKKKLVENVSIRLSFMEISEAISYWLTNAHDVGGIPEKPFLEFKEFENDRNHYLSDEICATFDFDREIKNQTPIHKEK